MPDPLTSARAAGNRLRTFLAVQCLLAVVLLAVAFGPSASSQVAAAPQPGTAVAAEPEGAEGEEWLTEEEEWGSEGEEGEEESEAGEDVPFLISPECVLLSADPVVSSDPARRRASLALRYTAEIPTRAGVELWLKGGKGSLQLGSARRQLGKRGTLRLSTRVEQRQTAKLRAARVFVVRLDLPATPSFCRAELTFRLSSPTHRRSRTLWSATG